MKKKTLPQVSRVAACEKWLDHLGSILFCFNHHESGRIIESIFQLLPDESFIALCRLVLGNEQDHVIQNFAQVLAVKLAQKLGEDVTEDSVANGSHSILKLIYCEHLRRQGYIEYLWYDNIFVDSPQNPGFTKITERGKHTANETVLNLFEGKYIN